MICKTEMEQSLISNKVRMLLRNGFISGAQKLMRWSIE